MYYYNSQSVVLFCLQSCCVCVQNLSLMYVLVCGCSGRSVCRQCSTVQLLSRVLWTSLAAITSALVQWTAIIHCSGVMYYYNSQSVVLFCLWSCCVCVQNLSFMYVLVCGCSGRSVCHQCLTVQLLSRVLWTSLAAITSDLVQWTAATIHCAGVMYYYHSQMFVNISIMYIIILLCYWCSTSHLWSSGVWFNCCLFLVFYSVQLLLRVMTDWQLAFGMDRTVVLCRICASAKAVLGDWFSSAVWDSEQI